MRERWELLEQRIAALDEEFHQHCRSNDQAQRLTSIPHIGSPRPRPASR
jgi:transposase